MVEPQLCSTFHFGVKETPQVLVKTPDYSPCFSSGNWIIDLAKNVRPCNSLAQELQKGKISAS